MNTKENTEGPIAKIFPDTTVMFADIKGFTQWSASRQPTDIFLLLENLHGGFERNATFCWVFKVETIGDTYITVVELPLACKIMLSKNAFLPHELYFCN
jgi:class 3 adenylate cyclase